MKYNTFECGSDYVRPRPKKYYNDRALLEYARIAISNLLEDGDKTDREEALYLLNVLNGRKKK